jgi:hypothetical protein
MGLETRFRGIGSNHPQKMRNAAAAPRLKQEMALRAEIRNGAARRRKQETGNFKLQTLKLQTKNSKLKTPNCKLQTVNSKL